MCGIPGSGKSTWCSKALKKPGAVRVSRDAIRFALLEEGEDYFAHEGDVYREFITAINEAIWNDDVTDILVDATHLNENSRNRLLRNLDLKNVTLNAVNFLIDLDLAWERNNMREGRAVVPYSVIRNMLNSYSPAVKGEKYDYQNIVNLKVTKEGVKAI